MENRPATLSDRDIGFLRGGSQESVRGVRPLNLSPSTGLLLASVVGAGWLGPGPLSEEHNTVALLTLTLASASLYFSLSLLGAVDVELFSTLPFAKCFRSPDLRKDAFRNEKIYCSKCKVVEEHRLTMEMSNFGKRARIRKSVSGTEQHEVTCRLSSLLPCRRQILTSQCQCGRLNGSG
ncbi:hypothetical protein F5141DRAFT_1122609 [Pisolithus sp. B1]|nr:hypothetical protein F5141DRAFT_1122609 [Pisolithus sp. B1]